MDDMVVPTPRAVLLFQQILESVHIREIAVQILVVAVRTSLQPVPVAGHALRQRSTQLENVFVLSTCADLINTVASN